MTSVMAACTFTTQELFYYCGPAAACMVLESAGAEVPTQATLWREIMGQSRGKPASTADGYLPGFPKQHCLKCATGRRCWYTTPDALRCTIAARVSRPVEIVADRQPLSVAARIVASLNRGFAPAVLQSRDHWVVVAGYVRSEPAAAPSAAADGLNVDGFFVCDPLERGPGRSRELQPVRAFIGSLTRMDCGPRAVAGRYVAIVS